MQSLYLAQLKSLQRFLIAAFQQLNSVLPVCFANTQREERKVRLLLPARPSTF
ncbi:MAG: hypothetical protein KME19_09925 [Microcoleus vaginatus WJT46-NPBG5]|nr:hypothetical protein [Microcoleus vaginatus WJT46-NPBG5]